MTSYPYNNTFSNNFQSTNQRDKTKSYLEPMSQNQFYNHINQINPLNTGNQLAQSNISSNISYHPSEKYKNFYNQYQDYRQPSVSQMQKPYVPILTNQKSLQKTRSNVFFQDKFSSTSPVGFQQLNHRNSQKSIQRKRFYTTNPGNQSWKNQNTHQFNQNSTNSMIFTNNNNKSQTLVINGNNEQINPKKDLFKFVNQKFAATRIQSTFNSREKRTEASNLNKSEYLQKANKKISLKNDIIPNSPKYKQSEQNLFNLGNKNQQSQIDRHRATSFFEPLFKKSSTTQQGQETNSRSSGTQEEFSSANSEVINQNKVKEPSFKKNSLNAYEVVSDLGSSEILSNYQITSPSGSGSRGQKFIGNIKANRISNHSNLVTQSIDPQIFSDMKISRIQQSTNNLQQKVQKIIKTLQTVSYQTKQHQININQLNKYITKQQQQGITSHDIKRIKKELKIMKTNFETAFTSMTDQINRKLIKEENIMKNLSEEIRIVAEENKKLNGVLQEKAKKVQNLQKSMSSFMRQNQERMQNLVLNDSYSSTKRSKNHSFEYGLDLKNMSGEQNNINIKPHCVQNMNKKIQMIQRQIKKMKVFHIQQKQSYGNKFLQLRQEIKSINSEQKTIKQSHIRQIIQNLHENIVEEINLNLLEPKLSNMSEKINQRQQKKLNLIKQEMERTKLKIQQLNKICHQQLYQFRMNKLQGINNIKQNSVRRDELNIQAYEQVRQIKQKQTSILISLSDYQNKLNNIQQKQINIYRNIEQQKLKQMKMSGDVRQMQSQIKQILNHKLKELRKDLTQRDSDLQRFQTQIRKVGHQIGLHSNLLANTQQKLKQFDRINSIQTQNIQSINNQFERVINRQIIPKFAQIHHNYSQINLKIHNLTSQIFQIKNAKNNIHHTQPYNYNFNNESDNKAESLKQLDRKIQKFFNQNLNKFINKNIKLIPARSITANQTISNLGLFKKQSQLYSRARSQSQFSIDDEQNIKKQDTYLIDQNGFLMDWQGAYLLELNQFGIKQKIKLTQQQIYFMEVNGINVNNNNGR